ncbi:DNA-binding protein WhiA [Atopobacter sp. AH10]|uniref:DNA-binding protein WhiA n=1 Tax=Atopobacter sp. AH10 TaxID=2315861 RepID=UPI000EF2867C|nr:DNA-binding protein WhiA [Atopobacter sp. AH10]RLK62545.1 DNA-binding protein WhiA [Atopobacter sp. AH10]
MSFASETKNELTHLIVHPEHARAELSAMIRMNGAIGLQQGKIILNVQTENAAIARRIYVLAKEHFNAEGELLVRRKMKLKKNNVYIVRFKSKAGELLEALHIMDGLMINPHVDPHFKDDEELRRSYLRGAFLATGSMNHPESASYHLEIYSQQEEHNEDLLEMLNDCALNAKTIDRRQGHIIYLKEAEKIGDFLALIGATNARLTFENIRIVRDLRNSANRIVNCEVANLNKVAEASAKQIKNIKKIDEMMGLSQLPEKLQQIALARLKFPDANLTELGKHVEGGPISKSGVNHRLRKLNDIADQLEKR